MTKEQFEDFIAKTLQFVEGEDDELKELLAVYIANKAQGLKEGR